MSRKTVKENIFVKIDRMIYDKTYRTCTKMDIPSADWFKRWVRCLVIPYVILLRDYGGFYTRNPHKVGAL